MGRLLPRTRGAQGRLQGEDKRRPSRPDTHGTVTSRPHRLTGSRQTPAALRKQG